jgi:hypothetical protein
VREWKVGGSEVEARTRRVFKQWRNSKTARRGHGEVMGEAAREGERNEPVNPTHVWSATGQPLPRLYRARAVIAAASRWVSDEPGRGDLESCGICYGRSDVLGRPSPSPAASLGHNCRFGKPKLVFFSPGPRWSPCYRRQTKKLRLDQPAEKWAVASLCRRGCAANATSNWSGGYHGLAIGPPSHDGRPNSPLTMLTAAF